MTKSAPITERRYVDAAGPGDQLVFCVGDWRQPERHADPAFEESVRADGHSIVADPVGIFRWIFSGGVSGWMADAALGYKRGILIGLMVARREPFCLFRPLRSECTDFSCSRCS